MQSRVSNVLARGLSEEEITSIFTKNFEVLEAEKAIENVKVYIFNTNSAGIDNGITRYEIENLDVAVKVFMEQVKIEAERIFIGFGVEYVNVGAMEGAVDLLMAGNDYKDLTTK